MNDPQEALARLLRDSIMTAIRTDFSASFLEQSRNDQGRLTYLAPEEIVKNLKKSTSTGVTAFNSYPVLAAEVLEGLAKDNFSSADRIARKPLGKSDYDWSAEYALKDSEDMDARYTACALSSLLSEHMRSGGSDNSKPTLQSFLLDESALETRVNWLKKRSTQPFTSVWRLDRPKQSGQRNLNTEMKRVIQAGYGNLSSQQMALVRFWDTCRSQYAWLSNLPPTEDLSDFTHLLLRFNRCRSRHGPPWSEEQVNSLLEIAKQVVSKTNDIAPSASGDSFVEP